MSLQPPASEHIRLARDGARATITLDRPDKHNALRGADWTALAEAIRIAGEDSEVRVLVLEGAGGKAFSTGADLAELAERDAYGAYENALRLQRVAGQLAALRKPSIAMLRGWAVGGGFELALGCSFRIASESARIGLPEVRVGTLAGAGGTQRVSRLAPRGVALRMLLLGEMLDAAAAREAGLVDVVASDAGLHAEVTKIVDRLTEVDPRTAALILDCVRLSEETSLTGGLAGEAALFGLTISYDGHRERIAELLGSRGREGAA